ncbi:hypothetical protein Hanom_Chr16g01446791 [Helianthus anomalus]
MSTEMEVEKHGNSEIQSRSQSWRMEELYVSATDGSQRISRAEEEDEDALKRAVLEKLPTFERLRTAFWVSYDIENQQRHVHKQVNVRDLGANVQQEIIETMFKVAGVDNGRILRKIRDRFDRLEFIVLPMISRSSGGGLAFPLRDATSTPIWCRVRHWWVMIGDPGKPGLDP